MKTKLFTLFVALLATTSLFAYDFQSGDLYYNITGNATVEVTYPKEYDGYWELPSSVTIPDVVSYKGKEYHVTSIGEDAFRVTYFTSITIPGSITTIGNGAFTGSRLISISLPEGVTTIGYWAFSSCEHLTSITLPGSITSIGMSAFAYCSNLTSVAMPDIVAAIGDRAFENCTALTSITLPKSVTSVGSSICSGCTSLSSVVWNVRRCEDFSDTSTPFFSGYDSDKDGNISSKITSFTFGEDVEYIPAYLCKGMSNLTSIGIPNNVIGIGSCAFSDCISLTSVVWNAKKCGDFAGYTATPFCAEPNRENGSNIQLTSFTFGEDVEYIPAYLCSGMIKLSSIVLPETVIGIGKNAFENVLNVVYSGTATGTPWGARSVNGYVDGYLVYEDATKTNLLGCNAAATGEIVLPDGVTSIGASAFSDCIGLTSVVIGNNVTSIGENAFYGCKGLTSFTIPNSVTSIGRAAFYYCESLTAITIPSGITSIEEWTFGYCQNLTSITIPDGVTTIGNFALYGCSSLTSVTLPNSVTSIGDYAFCYCSSLTSIIIPESVKSIGNCAFLYCLSLTSTITIPESVTSIGEAAFSGVLNINYSGTASGSPWGAKCVNGYVDDYFVYADETKTNLLGCSHAATGDITISESVTSIGEQAFSYCFGITSITIPENVTRVGMHAFGLSSITSVVWNAIACEYATDLFCCYDIYGYYYDWTSQITSFSFGDKVEIIPDYLCRSIGVGSITIPNSVTNIGNYAFSGCEGLTSIIIPNSVTSIGDGAFNSCTGLTSIVVEDGNAIYDSRNNCNAIIETATNTLIQGCKTTIISNNITSIGKYAFVMCRSLTSISIPNSVTSIGYAAFSNCGGLTSIIIPNSVTSIENYAFYYCFGLTEITCYATTVPETETYAFEGVNKSAKLYVPKESVADYKAHPVWGQFDLILSLSTIDIHDDSATGSKNATSQKLFHNGQLYIRHGDKTYTSAGIEL